MRPSTLLQQHIDQVREATSRYPVHNPRLFGSSARGDDRQDSDVDILVDPLPQTTFYDLGACPNSHCSILSESDSSLGYEQVFSSLEYRSDAASAAECAGLCAERPCLAVYR